MTKWLEGSLLDKKSSFICYVVLFVEANGVAGVSLVFEKLEKKSESIQYKPY